MQLLKGISVVSFLLVFYPLSTLASTWAITYGGEFGDNARSVQETSDGGYIVAGSAQTGRPDIDTIDYWVLKLDDKSNPVWQKAYDGPYGGFDMLSSLQETSDNGYIVAGYIRNAVGENDLWILKLDSAGDILWQNTYSGIKSDSSNSIQETSDGGFIVTGYTLVSQDTSVVEEFRSAACVLKLDEKGEIVWQKKYDERFSIANSIEETSDGGFVVVGTVISDLEYDPHDYWVLKLDRNGDVDWQKAFDGGFYIEEAYDVTEASDGGFLVAGEGSTSLYHIEAVLFKLDSKGDMLWQKSYDSPGPDSFYDVEETSDGMIVVAGSTGRVAYSNKGWILKLDGTGDTLWQKAITGGKGSVERFRPILSIDETQDGGFIAAGSYTPAAGDRTDYFVAKMDSHGNIPGCRLIQDTDVIPAGLRFSQDSLGTTHSDADVTVTETYSEPSDTQRVPQSPCSSADPLQLISSDFNTDADGFTYHDDTFNRTNRPRYANGEWRPDGGVNGGGLYVSVGGVDGVDIVNGMSGGWSKTFTMNADANAEISLSYSLLTGRYDADECAEVLVAIDGEVVETSDKLCGRHQSTGWVTASFNQHLTQGTHTLTVGAFNNKKTGAREKADAYFDDISIVVNDPSTGETECADGADNDGDGLADCDDSDCRDTSDCSSEPYLAEDFDTGHDLFQYQDDMFNGTHRAPYATGQWVEEGTSSSGGLQITLGNVDSTQVLDGISGGWQGHFSMSEASEVTVSVDYRLVMTRFDADECAQVLIQLDDGPVETAAELCGRGEDTGWQTHTFVQSLPVGEHSLSIGGFVNKKTGQREKADIYFDNVEVR